MKRIKVLFIFVIILFFTYICLYLIYKNTLLNKKYTDAYVLNKEVLRGNYILNEDVKKVKIPRDMYYQDIVIKQDIFNENTLVNENLSKGQIITKDMFVTKEEYKLRESKELITIDLDKSEILINSKLKKGKIINIYYIDGDYRDNSKLILENANIIGVYDDNANMVEYSNNASKIIILVSREKVMQIKNYQKKGYFSISIVN